MTMSFLNNRSADGLIRSSGGGAQWNRANTYTNSPQIAPVWFLANWSTMVLYFSPRLATVLMSTCSLFAFLFRRYSTDELSNISNCQGVLLGIAG
jgi:hypothetical protein